MGLKARHSHRGNLPHHIDLRRIRIALWSHCGRRMACSGIRSLISIFLMATIYGFVVFRSPKRRLIMIASGLPLAIIGNVVRLALIVASGEFFGQTAGNYVHENWFFSLSPYVPAIFGLLWLGRRLEDQELKERADGALKPEVKSV